MLNAVSDEFHGLVQGAVHTDLSDNVKNDVLSADVFRRFAGQHELNCGRYFKPSLTAYHTGAHIC